MPDDKPVRVRFYVSVGLVGCKREGFVEFDADEWNGWTDEQREEACRECAFSFVDWGYEEVKEAGRA